MTPCALIVPLRAFDTAKTRLSSHLSEPERGRLARLSAEGVLSRKSTCHRIVVCDSDDVATWAISLGVESIRVSASGLNAALSEALPHVRRLHPHSTLVIAHGDIVEPSGLDDVIDDLGRNSPHPIVIAPDRHKDGTNVLCLDHVVASRWVFEYGPGSFERHLRQARSAGWAVRILHDDGLATDLDTIDDLSSPLARSFLTTHFPHLSSSEALDT